MYLFLENQNTIIPLEVKASENLRSKSLKTFAHKYSDIHCYRTSLSDFCITLSPSSVIWGGVEWVNLGKHQSSLHVIICMNFQLSL